MKRRRTMPELSLRVVADSEALGDAIDEVLRSSGQLGRLSAKIRRAQRQLRRAVDEEAWPAYLAIEEVVNERSSVTMEMLVKWAYREGARAGARGRRPPR